ncbi:MAG: PilZ domain-containing protein [bacterium]
MNAEIVASEKGSRRRWPRVRVPLYVKSHRGRGVDEQILNINAQGVCLETPVIMSEKESVALEILILRENLEDSENIKISGRIRWEKHPYTGRSRYGIEFLKSPREQEIIDNAITGLTSIPSSSQNKEKSHKMTFKRMLMQVFGRNKVKIAAIILFILGIFTFRILFPGFELTVAENINISPESINAGSSLIDDYYGQVPIPVVPRTESQIPKKTYETTGKRNKAKGFTSAGKGNNNTGFKKEIYLKNHDIEKAGIKKAKSGIYTKIPIIDVLQGIFDKYGEEKNVKNGARVIIDPDMFTQAYPNVQDYFSPTQKEKDNIADLMQQVSDHFECVSLNYFKENHFLNLELQKPYAQKIPYTWGAVIEFNRPRIQAIIRYINKSCYEIVLENDNDVVFKPPRLAFFLPDINVKYMATIAEDQDIFGYIMGTISKDRGKWYAYKFNLTTCSKTSIKSCSLTREEFEQMQLCKLF